MKFKKLVSTLLASAFLCMPTQAQDKNNINLETKITKNYSETFLRFGKPAMFNPKNYLGFYLKTQDDKLSKDSYAVSNIELKVINTKFTLFSDLDHALDEIRTLTTLPSFSFFDNIRFGGGYGKKRNNKLQNLNSTFNLKPFKICSIKVSDLELALGYTKLNQNSNLSTYLLTRINNLGKLRDLFIGFGYNNHNYFAVIGNPTYERAHCSIGGRSFRFIPLYNSDNKRFRLYSLFASNAYFAFNAPVINLTNIDADRFLLVNKDRSLFHDINTGLRNPYKHEQRGRGLVLHSMLEFSPFVFGSNMELLYNFSKNHPYHKKPYDLADSYWTGFLYGVHKDRTLKEISHQFELKGGLTIHGYSLNLVFPLRHTKSFKIYATKNGRF